MPRRVFTDGSCLGNPGAGGWAVAFHINDHICGSAENTTNNIMEMTAVVRALEECLAREILDIELFTDSNYVKNGITSWIKKWKRNGWLTSSGSAVKNKHLWMRIDALTEKMNRVEWTWVKAHNGNILNELVDTLARDRAKNVRLRHERGSAPMV